MFGTWDKEPNGCYDTGRVPHAAQMNVISGLHGGRDNWMFTEQDFWNMLER
jgi:hypothetical protein